VVLGGFLATDARTPPVAGGASPALQRLRLAIWIACLLPLARLVWLGTTGGLGANPIEFVTRSTGTWTLAILLAMLCVTPLRQLTGWTEIVRVRRLLGLFAFFYACVHVSIWLGVD